MSKESVKRWNVLAGNGPSQGSLYDVWKQLKMQGERVEEEGVEIREACTHEDMENLIKEYADVWYTLTYMEQLLEAFGVDVKVAKELVCQNNDQKFTQSYTYASESKEALEEQGVECYIEEVVYQGEIYYTVRDYTGKVRKLKHHEYLDLSHLVPDEFK